MKKTLLLTLALAATTLAFAAKIYVNPGHGSWGANDRNIATITHPLGDTTGFYESNTNMWKCLYLTEKLRAAGHTVKMSHTKCGTSPALATVAAESQTFGADYFISVHSNALSADADMINFPAYFYRTNYGASAATCTAMAQASWKRHFYIFDQGMEFLSTSLYSMTKYKIEVGNYAVLAQSTPGYLVEGYFHTYQPARHRALNPEWCRQEGLRYFRGIQDYYGKAGETKGYIMGYIRTKDKQINQTYYTTRSGNDIYMPINGARVYLTNAAGDTIMTNCYNYVARKLTNQKCYTTDNNYNGVFAYEDLTPGTYTISVRASGYKKYTQTITVTADQTAYTQIFLTSGTDDEEEPEPTPTPNPGGNTDPGYDGTEVANATGLNPFAYGLTSELNADSTEITLRWWLNAPATTVKIVFNDGETDYVVRDYKNVAVDGYKDVIQTSALPRGKQLTWRVDVTGAGFNNATKISKEYYFFRPSSVDTDDNPESANFGRLLCTEAYHEIKDKSGSGSAGEYSTYKSYSMGAGIYEFDAKFDFVKGHNGGNTFNTYREDLTAKKASAPHRVRIADDGRVFATSFNGGEAWGGKVMWLVDAATLDTWTPAFEYGYINTSTSNLVTADGYYIAAPNIGFDVQGGGSNLRILMLSGTQACYDGAVSAFRCYEYAWGNKTSWSTAPTKKWFDGNTSNNCNGTYKVINHLGAQVQFDGQGGIWMCQYRGAATDTYPSLVYYDKNGTYRYHEVMNNRGGGGFRFNKDFTRVIISGGNGTNGEATVYTVSNDANGYPTKLTKEFTIAMGLGAGMLDFAWDYADNIYAISYSKEKLVAYALPHSNGRVISTPAATKYAFTLAANGEEPEPDPDPEPDVTTDGLNPFAYALSSALSADNTVLTVNYSLNATATEVNIVVLNGETVVKTIACEGIAKGTYSVEIPTAELPKEAALTWRVDVKGAAVTQATFVDNSVKLYCPTSIDIDNNPQNDNFGTVFVVEGLPTAKDNATYANYISYADGAGLYVLNADGTARPMPNQSTTRYGYNGGRVSQTRQYFNVTSSSAYSPYRVRVSDDGRIFVSSLSPDGQVLWEADPLVFSRPDAADWQDRAVAGWAHVMSDKNDNTVMATEARNCTHTACGIYGLYEGNAATGAFIAGPNVGFDVRGAGKDLKLLMLSGCKQAIVNFTPAHFYCDEYDLGEATMWNTAPSRRVFKGNVVNHAGTQVQYDGDGNVWMCQHRSGTDAATLMKFNADATDAVLYNEDPKQPYHRCGAIRFNNDYSQVAIATIGSGTGGAFTVYPVVDGMPVWNQGTEVDCKSVTHHSLMDFAWDYASNLYIAADAASGSAGKCVAVYAMPHAADRVVSTPAADKYTFTLPKPVYTVTATANDPAMGTVEGAGTYAEGATATLTATAAAGHKFVNWTVGEDVLTENPLTLTVTADVAVVANFAVIEHTVTATVNDPAMGSVEGAGTYAEGATATLTATANEGYEFVSWTVGEDVLTENPLTLTVTADVAVVANFAVIEHTVTATVNDPAMGSVEGAGTYAEGATATLTATANEGYEFVSWTVGEDVLTENPLTLTVDKDIEVVATFKAIEVVVPTYTVSVSVNDPAMGSVEGAGTYAEGATATLTATANEGYEFVSWTVGEDVLTENPLTLTVDKDIEVVATFKAIEVVVPTYTVSVSVNDPAMGSVEGAGTYDEGATATLTATAAEGYEFVSWTIGDETLTANPLSLTVTSDTTVVATFKAIEVVVPTYTVSVSVNDPAMGTVEGAGTYDEGATATLTATAAEGYEFVSWTVGEEILTENPLTLTVDKDIEVVATFQIAVPTDLENTEYNASQVEKILRDDRIYIRVNNQLYTVTGARAE